MNYISLADWFIVPRINDRKNEKTMASNIKERPP
jgi:hypothetical protein